MASKKKNLKFRKISEKVNKLGGTLTASNAQLERLFNEQHIKYVMTLEDQLKEDKAHLLLKQNTIETLEEDIKHKNNQIRRKNLAINKISKINKHLYRDTYELTRAYNGLAKMGQFAEELGVDIKSYNGKLPENNKYDFEHKHTLTETGDVKHHYKLKAKKKNKTNE